MNKRAGIRISLRYILGFVIGIMILVVFIPIIGNYNLLAKEKTNDQEVYFNELNNKIKESIINREVSQIFNLKGSYLLISFNNKDTEVNLKNAEIYTGNKKDIKTIVKKPSLDCTENCLCLCKTESKRVVFESDCLQSGDICEEYEKEILNEDKPFFLFGEGLTTLKFRKTFNKININF